jgi:selenocysteine-specific elongation factor
VGTTLAEAPIVAVSAVTGAGLPELAHEMERLLAVSPQSTSGTVPRLPVDRVFSVAGFGTVITGTLHGGVIASGDELRIYPHTRVARVRGLQTHQTKVSRVYPGSRAAVNLSGVTVDDIHRGDVLAPPKAMTPTQRIDARLRLLASAPVTLKQNAEVDFFTGAAELAARITLLDRERLEPGDTGWVQFRFRAPLAVLKGDRFIVRRASPSETIGGGEIVAVNPPRHKRFRPETLAALATLAAGSPDEILLQALERHPVEVSNLSATAAGLTQSQIDEALAQLVAEGDVVVLGARSGPARSTDFVVATATWQVLAGRLTAVLSEFHANQPMRPGIAREQARNRLAIGQPRLFDEIIAEAAAGGVLIDDGATLRLPDFQISLDPARRARADAYLAAIAAQPHAPPGPHEFGLDAETLAVLEHLGDVEKIADGVYFAPRIWRDLVKGSLAIIDRDGSLTLAQFRDHFGTSRKYAQAALEQMDRLKFTRRVGDDRVRGPRRPQFS